MAPSIVIIGPAPEADVSSIRSMAKDNGIAVFLKKSAEEIGKSFSDDLLGYFSYLPCSPDAINSLYSHLPLGANEHYLVFQRSAGKAYPKSLKRYPLSGVFRSPISSLQLTNIFNIILYHERASIQYKSIVNEVLKYRRQKHQFINLSTALSKHNNLDTLLSLILNESCEIMNADAGSIYIRERQGPGKPFTNKLRFKVSQNFSVEFEASEEFTIEINTDRIAPYVAATGEPLNIQDVYKLDTTVPYKFKKDFDRRFNYRMKSMLVVPLKDIEGEIVGVLQLMNKKRDPSIQLTSSKVVEQVVIDFSYSDQEFLQSIGALAAVSIERTQLIENIEQIFEGFLESSIAAIDERDRVTSGHSRRVMGYAMAFVDAINECEEGIFAKVHFSADSRRQFKFAALLHDIGKIGVPEALLNKEHRLSEGDFVSVISRFDIIRYQLLSGNHDDTLPWTSVDEIESDLSFLERINKAGYLKDEDLEYLNTLKDKSYKNSYGKISTLITEDEWKALSVRKGNLTEDERDTINSHAISSYRILSKIPWTHELEDIPDIAAHHHEKLDGTGYPDGLKMDEVRFEDKILAIIDVYDAVVAQDRPYKPAMPPEKAITILRDEAEAGHLDGNIVEFFVSNEIYKKYLD